MTTYPVPWARLTYNTSLGGYEVNISDTELNGAPKYSGDDWEWTSDHNRQVYEYYRIPPLGVD